LEKHKTQKRRKAPKDGLMERKSKEREILKYREKDEKTYK